MKQLSFTDREAKEILEKGSLLALPTETVYGLAVRADDPLAYERLVKVKNRRPDKPIAVMCSKNFDLEKYLKFGISCPKCHRTAYPSRFITICDNTINCHLEQSPNHQRL